MRKWQFGGTLLACLLWAACTAGLSSSTKEQINAEGARLAGARTELAAAKQALEHDLSGNPQLFAGVSVDEAWKEIIQQASAELDDAGVTEAKLQELARENRADSMPRVDRLLADEKRLRSSAIAGARQVRDEAQRWVSFRASLPQKLSGLKAQYESIEARNLSEVADVVHRAELDWPLKKSFLEARLAALNEIPARAEQEWTASETARRHAGEGSANGPDIATLIRTEDALNDDASRMNGGSTELRALSGQPYDSWDKILIDLDDSKFENDHVFRERIKTVRTHLIDPASKQSTTSESEQWVTVSEPAFRQVERDLGMAIAHKDVGLFDYEAQTTAQPAGFAYVATEQQGSNQYGYWAHDNGTSVWHWLPEYLILRELLWNHDYRPIVLSEYRGYQVARDAGRTFYGQASPTSSRPKYGTDGSFTATHYAGSKYVQSGGFKGSAYASNHASPSDPAHGSEMRSFSSDGSSAGKRFGFGAAPSSGRRFGQAHGSPSFGRRFGRR